MRIVIAVVSSAAHLSGVSRHAINLARCLLTRSDISVVHLLVATWQYDSLLEGLPHDDPRLRVHSVSLGTSALSRNRWYYSELPALAAQLGADVVHLAYPVPVSRQAFRCPTVVTLHDLYPYDFPANFGFPKVLFNRIILRQCLRAVDGIACVSETTLRQLDIHFPLIALRKAVHIYNCVEPGPAMAEQGPIPNWSGEPFLLCIAQHRRNKNILLALRIFHRLLRGGEISPAALLVIIGIEGPETAHIHRFIHAEDLMRRVVLLRGVSDAELQWCYGHCELLLAPSITEGFGLPVVEAMLRHCRVVCSDIPAFREVGEAYCHYASLSPKPEDTFVQAIRAARKSIKFRATNTSRFSRSRIADAYSQLYIRLCHGCSTDRRSHGDLAPQPQREGDLEHLT